MTDSKCGFPACKDMAKHSFCVTSLCQAHFMQALVNYLGLHYDAQVKEVV